MEYAHGPSVPTKIRETCSTRSEGAHVEKSELHLKDEKLQAHPVTLTVEKWANLPLLQAASVSLSQRTVGHFVDLKYPNRLWH